MVDAGIFRSLVGGSVVSCVLTTEFCKSLKASKLRVFSVLR